jgi:hypothetical protein
MRIRVVPLRQAVFLLLSHVSCPIVASYTFVFFLVTPPSIRFTSFPFGQNLPNQN